MITALLALLPCAVVIAAVLGLGWSGLAAAGAALVVALALTLSGAFAAPTLQMFTHATLDAALLTTLVAATTVPGIVFIEATRRLKSPEAISRLVAALRLPEPQTALLIALGLGIMVESLTGMGVSLLLTVPLLTARFQRPNAIALALIGMSLMPWGALAIGGIVGATLAGIDPQVFGHAIWRASGPVAAVLPPLAVWSVGARDAASWRAAILCSAVLCVATWIGTVSFGMTMAGVTGGLALLALLALQADRSPDWSAARQATALRPYLLLIAAAALQTVAVALLSKHGLRPAIATDRVSFVVLVSPGVALLAATLLSAARTLDAALARDVVRRSWRAIASVALFMLTARLLVSSGAIEALTATIKNFGAAGSLIAAVCLGAIGGFITGSGVTGNALFLPSAAAAGAAFDAKTLFAALASSAAGHTAMASLPVAALLLAALPNRTAADDRTTLRWGLGLATLYVAILIIVGLISLAVR